MTVLLSSLTFVLERRINYPLAEVEAALRGRVVDDLSIDVEGGALLVSQAFRPEPDPWYPTSRALGRLATRR